MKSTAPLVTVAVPSKNQGRFLEEALLSILSSDVPVEVFVMDAGSTDGSVAIIERYDPRLAGWRSSPDAGQSAAINEGIARGKAPFVCWLNSDDYFLEGGLASLVRAIEESGAPAVYANAWNEQEGSRRPAWVEPFDRDRLATRCIISQPATLIRRTVWEAVGGLDERLHMAMDYDLWWRIAETSGPLHHLASPVAVNREHEDTKTKNFRARHYREAMSVVGRHYGRIPLKWYVAQPYAVWYKSIFK